MIFQQTNKYPMVDIIRQSPLTTSTMKGSLAQLGRKPHKDYLCLHNVDINNRDNTSIAGNQNSVI